MCLDIIDEKRTKELQEQKESIIAYKIIQIDSNKSYCSPLRGYIKSENRYYYRIGEIEATQEFILVEEETQEGYISGFHMYLDKEDAWKILRDLSQASYFSQFIFILIQVLINPENVTCCGIEINTTRENKERLWSEVIVASKMTIESFEEVK